MDWLLIAFIVIAVVTDIVLAWVITISFTGLLGALFYLPVNRLFI